MKNFYKMLAFGGSGKSGGSGGGGGAEVKTCTVRIIGGDLNANFEGYYAYSKHENGATSLVEYEGGGGTRFNITLENVLCGSMILFWWNGDNPTIYTDMDSVKPLPTADSYGATSFYIEETATDCLITLRGSWAGGGGGDE